MHSTIFHKTWVGFGGCKLFTVGLLMFSIAISALGRDVRGTVDSLNAEAYAWRYKDVSRSLAFARRACQMSSGYTDGRHEALNHMAYVGYQQMDFGHAQQLALQVRRESNNQIEALVADVMLMKICQRTSRNRLFYVYRNSAERRIRRIAEERALLTERERERLLFAETEFYIVSSTYHYYLKQLPQALVEINAVEGMEGLRSDTAQWLYYNYMKGSGGLCEGADAGEVALREFDYLFKSFTLSKVAGYLYFEGNNLQALASLLERKKVLDAVGRSRPDGLKYLWNLYGGEPESAVGDSMRLSVRLARGALDKFRRYGDLYQVACAYRTMGELWLEDGRYERALDCFVRALDFVNRHHRRFYPADSLRILRPYAEDDTVSVEMQWMNDEAILTVPEWIAGIRERMSVAYSALGDKRKSDYNRNIYLDMLDQTRQDRELENRYEELEAGSKELSVLLALVSIVLILLVGICLYLYRLGRKRSRRQVFLLQYVLEACRWLMSSESTMLPLTKPLTEEEEKTVDHLLQPYREWAEQNRMFLQDMGDERRTVCEQYAVSEQRIARNKRRNVENRAKLALVYAIVPFIDRMLDGVKRLHRNDGRRNEHLDYVKELADRISLYNDILTGWIQLRRGELSLHIETFAVQDVFDVLKKGHRSFEQGGLTLQVMSTKAMVKADKALTLFMVNTLTDNARKFTPSGGTVTVEAIEADTWVEVTVTDTGCGLTQEEIDTILTAKVYDASGIGAGNEFARNHKGHGFGLMNCRGIIEKYRKTSELFRVCTFFVTGKPGQGSRFGFRLPRAVRRSLSVLLLCCSGTQVAVSGGVSRMPSDSLLQQARRYADSLYFANIEGDYQRALACSDSTLRCLNAFYRAVHPDGNDLLRKIDANIADLPPEVIWWESGWTDMDYSLLLGWRNETAVAALAQKEWELYRYNNDIYTQLYKNISQDQNLKAYCEAMTASQNTKRVGIVLLVCLAVAGLLVFYLFYFRRTLLFRLNLAQVLETNRRLLEQFRTKAAEADGGRDVEALLHTMWSGLNEIHTVVGMRLDLCDENGQPQGSFTVGRLDGAEDEPHFATENGADSRFQALYPLSRYHLYPLQVETGNERKRRLGSLLIHVPDGSDGESERLLDEMMVSYLSALLYGGLVRRRQEREDLELAEDERQRALYEESRLHVQNQILDNCLSTIKHEAMYYPGRIRQVAGRLTDTEGGVEVAAMIEELNEWVEYYRTLYTLLGRQAGRQLAQVNFRRRPCRVDRLLAVAAERMKAIGGDASVDFHTEQQSEVSAVTGDADLLAYLLELLLQAMVDDCRDVETPISLVLRAEEWGRFVRFTFSCDALRHTEEELHNLFMPDARHIPYLISKQIIREHDMFTNHCGCRIDAASLPSGGCCIWFTLPKNNEHETF